MKPSDTPLLATRLITQFRCVGASCEDTCCAGWTIEVDEKTRRKYAKTPVLSDAYHMVHDEAAMRCDAKGLCTQNREGWCTVQERFGEDFLGDSCYFFPRTYRRIGAQELVGASLACPETAHMTLYGDSDLQRVPHAHNRRMTALPDRLPKNLAQSSVLEINARLCDSLNDISLSPEQHMRRMISIGFALDDTAADKQLEMVERHLHTPPTRAISCENFEMLRLLHCLLNLAVADNSQYHPRLYDTIRTMEKALRAPLHWKDAAMDYTAASLEAVEAVKTTWQIRHGDYAQPLRRWIAAHVANSVFPFAGLTRSTAENAYLLAINFATVRLAIMCAAYYREDGAPPQEIVRICQSLARLLDHITNMDMIDTAYDQERWHAPTMLQSLVSI